MTKEELQTIKDRLAIAATANSPVRAVVAYDIVYVCDDIAVLIAEVERLQRIIDTMKDTRLTPKGYDLASPTERHQARIIGPGKTW